MGGRYLITGIQLGMLKLKAKATSGIDGDLLARLEEIEEQYVGDSDKSIEEDVLDLLKVKESEKKL